MSAQPPGQMPAGAAGADGPSEEEVRAYLDQMRTAPVEQVLAEVLQGLLNAAQVKVGRDDARLLLNTAATITDNTRTHLSDELAQQVDQALSQLRMAQVEAEQQAGDQSQPQASDVGGAPGDGASSPGDGPNQQAGRTPPGPSGSQTSKLWVPGQ